jgi:hypothetical protein
MTLGGGANQNTVPNAPVIGAATGGDTSASVTFTASTDNGGATITGYTVTSSPGGITASGSGSPIVVTGLTNGAAYTFTVTATNAEGTSAASAASNSVTPATVPVAPTIGTATAGDTEASVTFTANGTGGSAILDFTVTSTPGGLTATGASSPLVVTGLTNGVSYTFKAKATNAIGNSAESAASNAVTPAGAGAAVTWDPANSNVHLALSNGNLTATTSWDGLFSLPGSRGTISHNSGKRAIAFQLNFPGGDPANEECYAGMCTPAWDFAAGGWQDSTFWLCGADASIWFGAPNYSSNNGALIASGGLLYSWWNFPLGKFWVSATTTPPGDPEAGTGESGVFPPGQELFPHTELYAVDGVTERSVVIVPFSSGTYLAWGAP